MDLTKIWENLVGLGTTWGVRIIGVLFALFVASTISRWAQRALVRSLERRDFDLTLTRFFGAMVRYVILGGAVLGCLGALGFETASFAAAVAAIGLAIGLALQGTLANFASGVMLLIFRPFKVGDLIKVGGQLGIVEQLQLFTTDLKTLDNRKLVMPNGAIFGQVIENITHHDIRRVDIPVGVTYSADVAETRKVLETVPGKVEGVLTDPPAQIFLAELGASSVDWQVRVWCKTEAYWDIHQATIEETKRALDTAGLEIPFPQQDVHLDDNVVNALSGKK